MKKVTKMKQTKKSKVRANFYAFYSTKILVLFTVLKFVYVARQLTFDSDVVTPFKTPSAL